MCMCAHMFTCHKIGVEVRRRLAEVRSLLPLCGSQKLNSGCPVLASGAFVPQQQPKKTFFLKSKPGHVHSCGATT